VRDIRQREVDYRSGETVMRGVLLAPRCVVARPAIVLIHDAFGLGDEMLAIAERLAELGHTVFAADVWGDRRTPANPQAAIEEMTGDRAEWMARLGAALQAVGEQPEIDPGGLVVVGYCFGGSSGLELLRMGTELRGVVAIHPGLDLLGEDWSAARSSAQVLLAIGSRDPMATSEQRGRLEEHLDESGIAWELNLYSGAVHAFTSVRATSSPMPEVFDFDARSAERAWDATVRFLSSLFPLAAGS
jgi:dienelactone hydrolase